MHPLPTSQPTEDSVPTRATFELTSREWEVLIQVAQDLTNAEIASRLTITPKSVENYRARIGNKLNLKGPRLLARFARLHSIELRHWYQLLVGASPPP